MHFHQMNYTTLVGHYKELHIFFSQEEEHKHPISYGELYNKVYKRKDGQYVSSKAKNFIISMCLFYKY